VDGNYTLNAAPDSGSGGTESVTNTVNIAGGEFSIFAGINVNPEIEISYSSPPIIKPQYEYIWREPYADDLIEVETSQKKFYEQDR
jgi:hypothetical protein